jgi:hypothetical protein
MKGKVMLAVKTMKLTLCLKELSLLIPVTILGLVAIDLCFDQFDGVHPEI